MKEKTYIDGYEYYKILEKFAKLLKPIVEEEHLKYVYGIPKGGVSIAQYLAYNLNLRLVEGVPEKHKSWSLLIVDDIVETGKTLDDHIREYPRCTTAVLHNKTQARAKGCENIKPIYLYQVPEDIWIRYPYEPEDEPINR